MLPAHPVADAHAERMCAKVAQRMGAWVFSDCAREKKFGRLGVAAASGRGSGGRLGARAAVDSDWELFRRHVCFHAVRQHTEAAMMRAASEGPDAVVRALQAEASGCYSKVSSYRYLNRTIWFGEVGTPLPDELRRDRLVHPSLNWGGWACASTAALDIGANVGDTAVPIAAALGSAGLVLSFEWSVVTYMSAVMQAALNPGLRILPANVGVDSVERYDAKRLHRYIDVHRWLNRTLPAVVPHLSLIKIDVDDFNMQALESLASLPRAGASLADERKRPVVKMEWGGAARARGCGPESKKLWAVAKRLGYLVHAGDGTPLATCDAAKAFARGLGRTLRQFGGDNLLSDLMLLPPGVTLANRQAHCPPPLPATTLASVPRLPTPVQWLPEREALIRRAEFKAGGDVRHKAGVHCRNSWECG